MKNLARCLVGFLAGMLLVACGGGGGNDNSNGGGTAPPLTALTVAFDAISGPVTTSTAAAVTVRVATSTGAPVADGASVTLSVAPATVAQVSTPATPPVTAASAIATTTGGVARFLVHGRTVGTATLTAVASAPGNANATATLVVPIVATPVPASITFVAPTGALYIQASGGSTTLALVATLLQANGAAVGDPPVGNHNARIEITSGPGGGERLTGVNAAGNMVSGAAINLRTTGGVVSFTLVSGAFQGPIAVRVTADRADNNVDNGLQDPVNASQSIQASDGRLFDLDILNQNNVIVDGIGGEPLYRLSIVARATDRGGNPVLAGTPINFGLIDTPFSVSEFGVILGRGGSDGDPQEGGTLFSSFSRPFGTQVAVGDTLVVFGEEIAGQRDMEAARIVQQFNSPGSLLVAQPFNRNDGSGAIVDAGGVFPFAVGRAVEGQITGTVPTDVNGQAVAILTYPEAPLGRPIIVWAQGSGVAINGQPNLVADVERLSFAGVGPATLSIQPSSVLANRINTIQLCLRDALRRGVPNALIAFAASIPEPGNAVAVDGRAAPGVVRALTGPDGCTTAEVSSANFSGRNAIVTFSVAGAAADLVIGSPGNALLSVSPNRFTARGGAFSQTAIGMFVDGNGVPIVNARIEVLCTASGPGIATLSASGATTDANGRFQTTLQGSGFVTDPDGASGPAPAVIESGACGYRPVGNALLPPFNVFVVGDQGCRGVIPPPAGCPP